MADDLSPLAAALRDADARIADESGEGTYWEELATACVRWWSREPVPTRVAKPADYPSVNAASIAAFEAAKPAAPDAHLADGCLSRLAAAFRVFCETMPLGRPHQSILDELDRYANPPKPAAPPERPTCATCVYWSLRSDDDKLGDCRRSAPPAHSGMTWALVHIEEWCGEHDKFPAWIAARAEGGR